MKIKKLNTSGFSHHLIIVGFVVLFAVAGVAYLVASHADSPNSLEAPPIEVRPGQAVKIPASDSGQLLHESSNNGTPNILIIRSFDGPHVLTIHGCGKYKKIKLKRNEHRRYNCGSGHFSHVNIYAASGTHFFNGGKGKWYSNHFILSIPAKVGAPHTQPVNLRG